MRGVKIDRTGEENVNNFGSKMIISKYRDYKDIDVYFPEYDWTFKHVKYGNFKKGEIKCPYERRFYGVGYLAEGKYKAKENGKMTKCYKVWHSMLQRGYDDDFKRKHPTYNACEVCESWHNFQNFAKWYNDNYYEMPNEFMALDKDILFKGNKIYSPKTCVFVPQRINSLFTKRDNDRGNDPIGMTLTPSGNYQVQCNNVNGKRIYLGTYSNKEEAFRVYKRYKEKVIKEVIDLYECVIPEPHYSKLKKAMCNYRVEIDD